MLNKDSLLRSQVSREGNEEEFVLRTNWSATPTITDKQTIQG